MEEWYKMPLNNRNFIADILTPQVTNELSAWLKLQILQCQFQIKTAHLVFNPSILCYTYLNIWHLMTT
jgi:hypothetical protein